MTKKEGTAIAWPDRAQGIGDPSFHSQVSTSNTSTDDSRCSPSKPPSERNDSVTVL